MTSTNPLTAFCNSARGIVNQHILPNVQHTAASAGRFMMDNIISPAASAAQKTYQIFQNTVCPFVNHLAEATKDSYLTFKNKVNQLATAYTSYLGGLTLIA